MTLSPDQVTRWILSHHICNTVSHSIDVLFDASEDEEFDMMHRHREEGINRKKADKEDRDKIEEEFKRYSHPLQQTNKESLFNIVTGHIADSKVNVDQALAIGEQVAAEFKGNLPSGFYKPLKSNVVTLETTKKGVKIGNTTVYDMEKLYGRLLVVSQKREIQLESLLRHELAPVPSAIFIANPVIFVL